MPIRQILTDMINSPKTRTSNGNKKLLNPNLRFKLTLSIVLFGTLITGILSFLLYTTTRSQMRDDFKQRLLDIVSIGALSLNGETLDTLHLPEQEGNDQYLAIKGMLKGIKANTGDLHFVYTMRIDSEGRIMFVVDESDDPENIAHLGDIYTDASPFLRRNFKDMDTPLVENDFYTDRWGTWLTGYAPVFDSRGKRVGVLGVDVRADSIRNYEKKLLWLFITIFLLALLLSSSLGGILGKRLASPILELKEHAERIGNGDFETVVPVHSSDELGVLAKSFNATTGKLKELVNALQEEIQSRQAAEKKYRSIFENSIEGIFQSTLDGRLITVNPAFAELLGYVSPEDAVESITDIPRQLYANPDHRDEILSKINAESKVADFKIKMRKKDGGEIWTELTGRMIKGSDGETIIEGTLRDIGEKLAREEAEKEQQLAEAASQAKSEFLANMSHEIRTPMNAVMGLTHLALKTDLTEKQSDYLKKILSAARSLLKIINDILDFSKIEAGKLSIESIPIDVEEVMNSLADILSIKAEEKGLELLFKWDKNVPAALMGDPLRLEQILRNLVGNAIKFTENGNIVVAVRMEEPDETETGSQVKLRFSVTDTGIGLSETQIKNLFSSFSQADESITRKYGGTGLGLSICKKLVEMMGGRIWVESEPGSGSAFIFTAVFERQAEPQKQVVSYPADLKGMKVLVVDDNVTARDIICEMLESFSFRPFQAPSGEEALADLKSAQQEGDPYKLVIMDWKMPGMDGIQTAETIQDNRELSQIPSILMLTAYSHEEIQRKAEKSGIQSFLIKPVNPSLLFDAIMSAFSSSSEIQPRKEGGDRIEIQGLDQIRGASILLVEDYAINRQVATELLESEGFRVSSADHGQIAIEMLTGGGEKSPPYDLILMDLQMPVMDGLTATRKIRELPPEISEIPIVAMTAHALQSEKDKCFTAGMNDHIAKPIDPKNLIEVLAKWIKPGKREPVDHKKQTEKTGQTEILLKQSIHFDCASGLARVAGNRKLYLDLLKQFRDKFNDAANEIQALLMEKKVEAALGLAHAVKGMAGNLGANALQKSAGALEDALKNSRTSLLDELTSDFATELQLATDEIETLAEENRQEEKNIGGATDPTQRLKLMEELKTLIISDFGAALQKAEALKNIPETSGSKKLQESLLTQLENFEEEQALNTLEQLITQLTALPGE